MVNTCDTCEVRVATRALLGVVGYITPCVDAGVCGAGCHHSYVQPV
jgi:hypothetical protein